MNLLNMLKPLSFLCLFLLLSFAPAKKVKVYLVGDSTMSVKHPSRYPEHGWGMPFAHFFDQSVIVENRAQNGRSTRSFITEGRWKSITDSLATGDYVFIQFGHNDEVATKSTFTTQEAFEDNLRRYVEETLSAKAFPVLITPVARRNFDAAGNLVPTHEVYSNIVRSVAKETNTPLIDLDQVSMALLQKMGVEQSKFLFNKLEPGQHPNYPNGIDDNTHFNEYGARRIAELVLAEMKRLNINLLSRIVAR